ncbi:dUTP diphosphatase [Lysinibacillus sp. NPDC058147]|uniref:dUTP diphosphatase n=1 Tax=unclassified Lysinibacillus TaxID=2636778 RepID=UPI0036DD5E90
MNITKLFETQAALDEHIMQEHPELRGQNNLDWKLLALQVELGECANEWRGFKKWSKDQEPRTKVVRFCPLCDGSGDENYERYVDDLECGCTHEYMKCEDCDGTGKIGEYSPLLEEYVDCLSFKLTIGLEIGAHKWMKLSEYPTAHENGGITLQFLDVHSKSLKVVEEIIRMESAPSEIRDLFTQAFESFLQLGAKLGFTWDEVETAYYEKNKINHTRQENGY